MMPSMARAAVVVLLALGLASCAWTRNAPTQWDLAGPVDGTRLELLVHQPGTGACRPFASVDVTEDADTVRITARVRTRSGDDCPATSDTRLVVVELAEPLGDRELLGCRPDRPIVPGLGDPGTNCGA